MLGVPPRPGGRDPAKNGDVRDGKVEIDFGRARDSNTHGTPACLQPRHASFPGPSHFILLRAVSASTND